MQNAKMTKKQRMAEQILAHGFHLQAIFPDTKSIGPVTLCKKLHRLEIKMHREAEKYCNGDAPYNTDENAWDKVEASALASLRAILGNTDIPLMVNGDPRGYALKIDDSYMRKHQTVDNPLFHLYQDLGGYGILAPEFNGSF